MEFVAALLSSEKASSEIQTVYLLKLVSVAMSRGE